MGAIGMTDDQASTRDSPQAFEGFGEMPSAPLAAFRPRRKSCETSIHQASCFSLALEKQAR
jgi:hypothetical protein